MSFKRDNDASHSGAFTFANQKTSYHLHKLHNLSDHYIIDNLKVSFMATIIRTDLTISGTYKLTDATQIATGVKITVLPGATFDLGGFSLLNYGVISLEGNSTSFATLQNGTYRTGSAGASLNSSYGNFKQFNAESFSSNGLMNIDWSLIEKSSFGSLPKKLSNSTFIDSYIDFGFTAATVDTVTFFNSPISITGWMDLKDNHLSIVNSNFIGEKSLINFSTLFSGPGIKHSLDVSNSYLSVPAGIDFESMVYDATDDLRITRDLKVTDFLTKPVTNSINGFVVGSYTISLAQLQSISAPVDTIAPTISLFTSSTGLSFSQPSIITFTLSESSTNFIANDINVSGGTISNFIGSGTSYSVTFTPSTDPTTTYLRVSVASGAFTDSAGNQNNDGLDDNNRITLTASSTVKYETHTLSVIVDKGVLGFGAVLLKGLTEQLTITNGTTTSHTVEYAGSTFNYNQIDALITTVVRDGEFSGEFRKELTDALPTTANLSYGDAVVLVGTANIDNQLLYIAGIDGNFVS